MPLCDPNGCNFEYTTEGLPTSVAGVTIFVKNMNRAISFYRDILRLEPISEGIGESTFLIGSQLIILMLKPEFAGKDTGIFLGVDDPFVFHRRMVDEGIIFTEYPTKGSNGVYASFRDDDGNLLHVISARL